MKRLALLLPVIALNAQAASLPKPDADNGGLNLPQGFRALVVAPGDPTASKDPKINNRLRFITVAPNGDLYGKGRLSSLYALRDSDGDGRFDITKEFGASGPQSAGTGVMLHGNWLYYSSNTGVYRYAYQPGQLVPEGEPETIVEGLTTGGGHDAKSFGFDEQGRLLVEQGSPFNVYSDGDRRKGAKGKDASEFLQTHGGFWRFDADKPHQTLAGGFHYSTGHRHMVAFAWQPVSQSFFGIMMGRDNMNIVAPEYYDALDNAERVSEEMHQIKEGVNLGWPYTYWDPIKQARMVSPEFGGDNRKRDDNPAYDKPVIPFPGHWAALQMAYYDGQQFPARYRGGMFVAFHGSWNRAPRSQAGYKIVFIPFDDKGLPTGQYETFADGFSGLDDFVNANDAKYRPSGVAVGPDGSLYITEDNTGRIWRVIYTGDTAPAVTTKPVNAIKAPAAVAKQDKSRGSQLYLQVCAACHMPNGGGVPNMQPALSNNALITGNPKTAIRTVLYGGDAALPASRPVFSNKMPAFGSVYDDADIAELLSYLRRSFGNKATPVTAAQVAAERKKP